MLLIFFLFMTLNPQRKNTFPKCNFFFNISALNSNFFQEKYFSPTLSNLPYLPDFLSRARSLYIYLSLYLSFFHPLFFFWWRIKYLKMILHSSSSWRASSANSQALVTCLSWWIKTSVKVFNRDLSPQEVAVFSLQKKQQYFLLIRSNSIKVSKAMEGLWREWEREVEGGSPKRKKKEENKDSLLRRRNILSLSSLLCMDSSCPDTWSFDKYPHWFHHQQIKYHPDNNVTEVESR